MVREVKIMKKYVCLIMMLLMVLYNCSACSPSSPIIKSTPKSEEIESAKPIESNEVTTQIESTEPLDSSNSSIPPQTNTYSFEMGYLRNKPWETPDCKYSVDPVSDGSAAEEIARILIGTHAQDETYTLLKTQYDIIQKEWQVDFQFSNLDSIYSIRISNNCHVSVSNDLDWSPLIPNKETVIQLANCVKKNWEKYDNGFSSNYELQYVFYEKKEDIWIVSFRPNASVPSSEIITMAVNSKDCSVINAWLWGLGFGPHDKIIA